MNLYIKLIGILLGTQKVFTCTTAVGGNRAVHEETQNHPQITGNPSHVQRGSQHELRGSLRKLS